MTKVKEITEASASVWPATSYGGSVPLSKALALLTVILEVAGSSSSSMVKQRHQDRRLSVEIIRTQKLGQTLKRRFGEALYNQLFLFSLRIESFCSFNSLIKLI